MIRTRIASAVCIAAAFSGCNQSSDPAPRAAPSAAVVSTPPTPKPLIAGARGWSLPAADPQAGWRPTRKGVTITPGTGTAFEVAYTRDKGTASGAAFMIPPGGMSGLKSIVITGSATPDQRLHVCATDTQGIVWTFPTVRVTGTNGTFELPVTEVGPDPFQNAGKTPPPSPDWSAMTMLTILDISGHMGAPSTPCAWKIESVEGVTR